MGLARRRWGAGWEAGQGVWVIGHPQGRVGAGGGECYGMGEGPGEGESILSHGAHQEMKDLRGEKGMEQLGAWMV